MQAIPGTRLFRVRLTRWTHGSAVRALDSMLPIHFAARTDPGDAHYLSLNVDGEGNPPATDAAMLVSSL